MSRNTTLTVSIDALTHNLSVVKQHAPNSKVLAMVKANAYGHGVENAIQGFANADALGVACMQEALELRKLGWKNAICLIEGVFSATEWQQANTSSVSAMCVIHHDAQVKWALEKPFTNNLIWLKVNTGMNRLGMSVEAAKQAYHLLSNAGYDIVLTQHFANADAIDHPLNQQQIQKFQKLIKKLKETYSNVKTSGGNSAAIVNFPELHGDWVRPGIMLYGATPTVDKTVKEVGLIPAMTFTAQILTVHHLKKGDFVGYGSLWQAEKPSKIAVVSCGYGDGYPRVVENAKVAIKGQQVPIIGRVSMDMLMVDVTALDAVSINDEVELWGNHMPIDKVATCANTISYELFCRLTDRPNRHVVKSSSV